MRRILSGGCLLVICSACLSSYQPSIPPQLTSPYPLVTEIHLHESNPYFIVDSLDWNPADDQIAIGSNTMTYLYSLEDEDLQEIREQPGRSAAVTWSSDGLKLAGTEMRLWIWDSQTNQVIYNVNVSDPYADYGPVHWSQDGNSIISSVYHLNTRTSLIEIWDIATGQVRPLKTPSAPNPVMVDWSPDEELVAIAAIIDIDNGPIQIVEVSSGKVIHTFPDEEIRPAAWDSSGTRFVTNTVSGDAIISDTANWQRVATLPNQGDFNSSIEWRPQSDYLAAAGDSGVIVWNVDSAVSTVVHDQLALDVAWSMDGKKLATAIQDTVYLWDVAELP